MVIGMVESIEELRKICRKEGQIDAEDFPYRKISIYFTKLLLYTPITANQTTLLSIFFSILSGLFFALTDRWCWILGYLLYELYVIFDFVDGEIARYRKQSSLRGKYLDYLAHYFVGPFIFSCMGFGIYRELPDIRVFLITFSLVISSILIIASVDCWYKVIAVKDSNISKRSELEQYSRIGKVGKLRILLYLITRMFSMSSIVKVVFIASILDGFIPYSKIVHSVFNYRILVLLFYGIALPFLSVARIIYTFHKEKIIGLTSFLK